VITLRTKRFANASGNCCRKKKLTYYLVTNSRVGVGKKTHKHTHTCIVRQDNERALIADGWLRSNKPVKLQRFDHWHERCCNFIIPRLHNITGEIFLFFAQPSRVWFIILFSPVWPRNDGWPHCTVFFFYYIYYIYSSLFNIIIQLHSYLYTFYRLSRSLDSAYLVPPRPRFLNYRPFLLLPFQSSSNSYTVEAKGI